MDDTISDAELSRLIAACVDADGIDVQLQATTQAMSPQARKQSQENLRSFVREVRTQIREQLG